MFILSSLASRYVCVCKNHSGSAPNVSINYFFSLFPVGKYDPSPGAPSHRSKPYLTIRHEDIRPPRLPRQQTPSPQKQIGVSQKRNSVLRWAVLNGNPPSKNGKRGHLPLPEVMCLVACLLPDLAYRAGASSCTPLPGKSPQLYHASA